jgi:hypothetical protein
MANKKNSPAKRKSVPRHTRKYQFRNDHPMDQHVEDILNFWKRGKQEITNLRKAVALYYALEQGDLPELFEVFPQYKAQFAPNTADALEQFMQILQRQQIVQEPAASPKQIAAPSFAMPIFEDDDQPTVLVRTSTSTDSSLNFVTALTNMK